MEDIPLNDDHWSAVQNRKFKNLKASTLFDAAKKVFKLSDSARTSFDQDATTLVIERVVGSSSFRTTDHWVIEAVQQRSNLKVFVHVSSLGEERHYLTREWQPDPYFNYQQGGSIAAYSMFWDRVNFVLGRSEYWPTCNEALSKHREEKNRNVAWLRVFCSPSHPDIDPRDRATN